MVEPTRRLVEHAHFAKRVLMKKGVNANLKL